MAILPAEAEVLLLVLEAPLSYRYNLDNKKKIPRKRDFFYQYITKHQHVQDEGSTLELIFELEQEDRKVTFLLSLVQLGLLAGTTTSPPDTQVLLQHA